MQKSILKKRNMEHPFLEGMRQEQMEEAFKSEGDIFSEEEEGNIEKVKE